MGLSGLLKAVPVIGQAIQAAETVGSFATSLINRHAQKENNKRIAEQNAAAMDFQAEQNLQNMAFNREEAEKARKFNAEQSELAFQREAQFNREMWEKENEYNSPSAQVQRLIDAGVNPNVFGGQNTAGSVSAASSTAASSNPASVNLGGTPSLNAPSPVSLTNPLLEAAQIRLANASAEKAENEANRTKELTPYEIESQKANISLVGSQIELNKQQKQKLSVDTDAVVKSMELMNSQIMTNQELAKLNSESAKEKANANKLFDETFDYAVKEVRARYNLLLANADELRSQMKANLARAFADIQQGNLSAAQAESYALPNFMQGMRLEWLKDPKRGFPKYKFYELFNRELESNKWSVEFGISEGKVGTQKFDYILNNDFLIGTQVWMETIGRILGSSVNAASKAIK